MTKRTKFGFPTDDAGNITNMSEWPWKIRYPLAFLVSIVGLAIGYYLIVNEVKPAWIGYGFAGFGLFFALCLCFELFLLAFLAGVIWGFVWLISLVLPTDSPTYPFQVYLLGAAIGYLCYMVFQLSKSITQIRTDQAAIYALLDQMAARERNLAQWRERGQLSQ